MRGKIKALGEENVESEQVYAKKPENNLLSKMKKVFNCCFNFIKEKYGYFLLPIFIAVIFGVALATFGIWPFGKTIMASYDMLAQVCPMLEHFFDVFSGESGLFHTFYLGGGMDMFGILAYCAVSPFTFLFLLAGEGGSIYMVSIVLPLKLICISLSAFVFLRVYFKRLPQYVQVFLAILYAYSGYTFVANTYIIWLDIMTYMPILGAGFIEFVNKKKIRLLVIGLAINIYACFSIVCFSFFTLFPVFVCYILICKDKKEWREYLSKLCLAFVFAVAVSLPILIPSLFAYLKAGRNTGIFSQVFLAKEQKDMGVHLYEKLSYIFTDTPSLALVLVYFFRSKKDDKTSYFLMATLAYLLIPCIVDESMLLLNMGSYNSYALRFGFLISFYFLFVGAKAIDGYLADKADDFEPSKKKSAISMLFVSALVIVGVLFTFRFFNYIYNEEFRSSSFIMNFFGENSDMYPFQDFFACFAHSEGALEGVGVLLVVMTIIFIVSAVLVKFKCVRFQDIACFLIILSLSQTVFYNFSLVKGNRQGGSGEKFDYYNELLSNVEDDETYRLKSYGYYISADAPLILGEYSHSFFSSMADAKNTTLPKFFGYGGSHTIGTRSNYGTIFSDALMGYKYTVYEAVNFSSANGYVKDNEYKNSDKYFLTQVGSAVYKYPSVKVAQGVVGKTDQEKIWINLSKEEHGVNCWSSLKIVLDGNVFKGYLGEELIYSLVTSSDEIVRISAITKDTYGSFKNLKAFDGNGKEIAGEWTYKSGWKVEDGVYTTIKGDNSMEFTPDGDENLKTLQADVCFTESEHDYDYIGISVTDSNDNEYKLLIEPNVGYKIYQNALAFPLASVINSGELKFSGIDKKAHFQQFLTLLNDGETIVPDGSTTLNSSKTAQLRDKLKQGEVKYTLVKNGIKFEPFVCEKGKMLYLNYVNLDGYKVYVNGTERELKDNDLDIMLVDLDEGKNVVEIKYVSPYISYVLIGVMLGALIIALGVLAYKVKPIVFEKVSVVIPYLAIGLALAITIFFFIYPIGIYISKFFGTYIKYFFV
ncbi:MAG: YfhO family protein [Clostridia bacterium]|nr:YfhO family protein [Clostridia bacterium]